MGQIQSSVIEKSKLKIREALPGFEGRKILVIGDVGLDEYLSGDVRRISPEAPVPVVEVQSREFRVGLAANVAQNIQSLGGSGLLVSVVGDDEPAKDLGALLKSNGVAESVLIGDSNRPTTRKVRVMSGQHHVVRVDFEEKKYLSEAVEVQMLQKIQALLPSVIGVILQDYGKGVLSENAIKKIVEMSHKMGKKVVVDPHRTTPIRYYLGVDLIKPNRDEAFVLSGLNIDDLHLHKNSILEVGQAILAQAQCSQVIITQGKDGALLFEGKDTTTIPTEPRQVFDVTGAGDTHLAAFCLGWFSGLDIITSAVLANFAAGVVVGKIGSVPCTQAELLEAMA